jgi:hypothetical protein
MRVGKNSSSPTPSACVFGCFIESGKISWESCMNSPYNEIKNGDNILVVNT